MIERILRPLPCAGRLGNCPPVKRFRSTCLTCRWRRAYYRGYRHPPFWIEYTYVSQYHTYNAAEYYMVMPHVTGGFSFEASEGTPLVVTEFDTLKIDPRGRFTAVRCAAIIILDKLMRLFSVKKPLVEVCEFFANYPA